MKRYFRIQMKVSLLFHCFQKFLALSLCLLPLIIGCIGCGNSSSVQGTPRPTPHPVLPPSVYLLSQQGDLDAYRADGIQLWSVPSDGNSDSGVTAERGNHLFVTKQAVYMATDAVRAYTPDGRLLWQHTLSAPTDDALLVGSLLYVVEDGGMVTAWKTINGSLAWQASTTSFAFVDALAHDGQHLFIGEGSQIVTLNLQSGTVAWKIDNDAMNMAGDSVQSLEVQGNILLLCFGTSLQALQASSGNMVWQRDIQVQSMYLDPAGILYTVYIDVPSDPSKPGYMQHSTSGLRALDITTGKQTWNTSFPIQPGQIGMISDLGIIWASQTEITAWDLHGKQRWQQPYQGAQIVGMQSVSTQRYFLLVAQDATMLALTASTGQQRWQQTADGSGQNLVQMTITPSLIWIVDEDMSAFDPVNGKEQWVIANLPQPAEVVTTA